MVYLVYMYEKNENLNTDYYPTLDENFKEAVALFEKETTQEELLKLLKSGNVVQKQIAALKITAINSFEEALILVDNLTGQDGKIREAVSLKISELKDSPYLHQTKIYDKFLDAITDINGNICRNIINTIDSLKSNDNFCKYFSQKLLNMTNDLIEEVKDFDFQDGKYKVNKEVFKLYWCLEGLYHIAEMTDITELKKILSRTKNINEYKWKQEI